MKVIHTILVLGTLVLAGCQKEQPPPPKAEDESAKLFERKIRCSDVAEKKAKERFPDGNGGFEKVIYSSKRNSCVASVSVVLQGIVIYSVEDILTGEQLHHKLCSPKLGCNMSEAQDQREAEFKTWQ